MNRQPTISVVPVISLFNPSRADVLREAVVDRVTSKNGPVCLIRVPSEFQSFSGTGSEQWREWLLSGRIAFLPAGFAGAVLPLLSDEELGFEIDWSVSNQWRGGFRDLFGVEPTILAPLWPDSERLDKINQINDERIPSYKAFSLGLVTGNKDASLMVFKVGDGKRVIPWVEVQSLANSRQILRQVSGAVRESSRIIPTLSKIFVVVEYEVPADVADFTGFWQIIDFLEKDGYAIEIELSVDRMYRANLRGELSLQPNKQFLDPIFRSGLNRLAEVRRKRSEINDRFRQQLHMMVPASGSVELSDQSLQGLRGRSLVASMQGETSIRCDDFDVLFKGGRFRGFTRDDESIDFGTESGTKVMVNGQPAAHQTESAVSFETDRTFGLRESRILSHPLGSAPGQLSVDYIVVDDCSWFLVDVEIRFPRFPEELIINEVRPFEFSLPLSREAAESGITIFRDYLDDSSIKTCVSAKVFPEISPAVQILRDLSSVVRSRPHKDIRPLLLPGHAWTFKWKSHNDHHGFRLQRMPSEERFAAPLEIRLRPAHRKKSAVLEIYPEGQYYSLRGGAMGGLTQHFVLALYPIFRDNDQIPDLPMLTEKEVNGFFLARGN